MKPLDVLLAIGVATVFGCGVVFSKAAMHDFPPILLMAFRFGLTGLVLVWMFRPPWHLLGKIFWVALVSAVIQYSLTFTGLKHLDVSTMILVVQLEVPFAALLAWFVFRDPLGWRGVCGMLLAFAGIAVIAGAPERRSELFPVMLVIAGAVVWAIGQIMVKKVTSVGGFRLIAWVAVIASPQLLIASWLFEDGQMEAIINAAPIVWIAVVYLALVMTAIGYAVWYHLLGRYDVNQVVPYLLLVPVTTVAGGILFLGETLTWSSIFGGVLVIGGVAALTIKRGASAEESSTRDHPEAAPGVILSSGVVAHPVPRAMIVVGGLLLLVATAMQVLRLT